MTSWSPFAASGTRALLPIREGFSSGRCKNTGHRFSGGLFCSRVVELEAEFQGELGHSGSPDAEDAGTEPDAIVDRLRARRSVGGSGSAVQDAAERVFGAVKVSKVKHVEEADARSEFEALGDLVGPGKV